HIWHKQLCDRATHKLSLCLEDGTYSDSKGSPATHGGIRTEAFFMDSRYEKRAAEKLVVIKVPDLKECRARTPAPPRQVLPMQSCEFLKSRPMQHISIPWFLRWGPRCLPAKLLSDVVIGLKFGFRTRYRGKGDFVRNYSSKMK